MKLEVITELSGLVSLRDQWQQLLAQSNDNSLPLTHGWICAWWEAFGGDAKLNVCCIREGHRLIAIAPLMIERGRFRRIPVSTARLMTNGASPYCDIIVSSDVSPDDLASILKCIVDHYPSDIFLLSKLPEDSKVYTMLSPQPGKGCIDRSVGVIENINTPVIPVDQAWEAYFGQRSSKFRKGFRNQLNRAKRQKDFRIEHSVISSRQDPAVEIMIDISRRSWKSRLGTDLVSDKRGCAFLLRIIDMLSPRGSVQIWIAWKGTVPIAYEFLVDDNGVAYPLRADFDMAYVDLRPGHLLMYTVLKNIFEERRFHLYYSCGTDYDYLRHWTPFRRQHYDVYVFGSGLKSQMLNWVEFAAIPKARVVRDALRGVYASLRGRCVRWQRMLPVIADI